MLSNDTDTEGDTLTAALDTDVSNGTLALSSDGSFTYTPNANFNGEDSFTYTATDGLLSSNSANVSITVTAPKGSLLNAEFPSPVVYANHEISHRLADMVMGALVHFWPGQVMACSQGTSAILTLGGVDSGVMFLDTIRGDLFGLELDPFGLLAATYGVALATLAVPLLLGAALTAATYSWFATGQPYFMKAK